MIGHRAAPRLVSWHWPTLIVTTLLLAASFAIAGTTGARSDISAHEASVNSRAIFERRILPLLQAKNPSSCSECHLSGVDLKNYIRPSEATTFAALRDRGMVDVRNPSNSRILKFILMSRPKTPLVTQRVRNVEYTAFHDWIVAAAKDPKIANARSTAAQVGPPVPDAVIRHTRMDTVVGSFTRNIWSQQGRCMNCHEAGTADNNDKVQKFGERVAWFKPDSPEDTMKTLIKQGDVDIDNPEQSLILLKPLGKVSHGGGVKFLYGDAGYKMFRAWVEDYAASVKGKYRTAADLPPPPTTMLMDMKCVLEVSGGPMSWRDRSLRVDVFPWDATKNGWATAPAATGERPLSVSNGGTATNLIMFLIARPDEAPESDSRLLADLGRGKYLLKYYVDTSGRLDKDYTIPTNSPDFYQGQQEVNAAWNAQASWGAPVQVRIAAGL